jgi:hypothetical protein
MTTQTQISANQIEPEWLDGRFLQRLRQREQRPGVIYLQQANTIQTRMAQMTLGQPLADAVQQRWMNSFATDAAFIPIVLVQPPSPLSPELNNDPQAAPVNPSPLPIVQPSTLPTNTSSEMPQASITAVIQPATTPDNFKDQVSKQPPIPIIQPSIAPKTDKLPPSLIAVNSGPRHFWADMATSPRMGRLPVVTAVPPYKPFPSFPDDPKAKIIPQRQPVTAANPISTVHKPEQADETATTPPLLPKETPSFPPDIQPLPIVQAHQKTVPVHISNNHSQGQPLPLARPAATSPAAGVIQRSPANSTTSGSVVSYGRSTPTTTPISQQTSARTGIIQRTPDNIPSMQSNADIEQAAVRLQRQWLRHLEIEAERRGIK